MQRRAGMEKMRTGEEASDVTPHGCKEIRNQG
jgi:hypothetical protein